MVAKQSADSNSTQDNASHINEVLCALLRLEAEMIDLECSMSQGHYSFHSYFDLSAQNLIHYIALRQHDLRSLQSKLANIGIRALGFTEAHVRKTISHVIDEAFQIAQDTKGWMPTPELEQYFDQRIRIAPIPLGYHEGRQLLLKHTQMLLGEAPEGRDVRIMVTMPKEATSNGQIIHDLLAHGMNCMRINCAHDDQETWLKMIEHLRHAEQALGTTCRVMMDLGGPKLRTAHIPEGPTVLKIKPQRDDYGQVIKPAKVLLTDQAVQNTEQDFDGVIVVESLWLEQIKPGRRVALVDARDANRVMYSVLQEDGQCVMELMKTAYFIPTTRLYWIDDEEWTFDDGLRNFLSTSISGLPSKESFLLLKPDDNLIISSNSQNWQHQNTIGCTLFEAFSHARVGERVLFDDGKIEGLIESVDENNVEIKVTRAKSKGSKLRNDKGINLPDTQLHLDALTIKDREDLAFVVEHADAVALSFVNRASDVNQLMEHIKQIGDKQPAIILKIETNKGFKNLPEILLTVMQWHSCGVMIARGDLAVECGFERLAEVQEEILWLCEAAHVPVIWATQVLEQLAKDGLPSRSEISDVTLGHRAECIMLNKGPHILSAVAALDNIIRRMQTHQIKQEATLRQLKIASEFNHS